MFGTDATFDWDDVTPLVEEVADADRITIFAGAGVSFESGMDDWSSLVLRLLRILGRDRALSESDSEIFADWTVQRDGVMGAAAVVKLALADRFGPELRNALYGDPPSRGLVPGETARAIAEIMLSGIDGEVATTNYDRLIEDAIADVVAARRIKDVRPESVATARSVKEKRIVVRHLHGLLTPTRTLGKIVLSESEYHRMQDDRVWQQQYFAEALADSQCVFLGTSLTDTNLLRYLYREPSDVESVVVFVRQSDAARYTESPSLVCELRERSSRRRWTQLGLRPILVDNYAESAQVAWEIAARRVQGNSYVDYPTRLAAWNSAMRGVLTTGRDFANRQGEMQAALLTVIDVVRDGLAAANVKIAARERLGCSLWIYRPARNELVNWASSDRLWTDPRTLEPVPVRWDSTFVSVQAFCSGSYVSESTVAHLGSRWSHVYGVPLYAYSDAARIPVGVLTLASTVAAPRSALKQGETALRQAILPDVRASIVANLLAP